MTAPSTVQANDAAEFEAVLTFRRAASLNGYRWLPVQTGAKTPAVARWNEDGAGWSEVSAYSEALNTGISCDGLVVIDADVDDAATADKVWDACVRHLGEPGMVRHRANSTRFAAVYRAAQGRPGKLKVKGSLGAVEQLGKGQQLVADGTHPSGARIEWSDGCSPATVPRDRLPAVSETQREAFLAECRHLVGASSTGTGGAAVIAFQGAQVDGKVAEALAANGELSAGMDAHWFDGLAAADKRKLIEACLGQLDNTLDDSREKWLRFTFAVADAGRRGCPDARELALNWSKRGASWTGEADFEKAWASYKPGAVTVGTLLYAATQAGVDLTRLRSLLSGQVGHHQVPSATAVPSKLVIDWGAPLDIAKQLVARHFLKDGHKVLRRYRGQFYEKTGARYRELSDSGVLARLYTILDDAVVSTETGSFRPANPNKAKVANVQAALEAYCLVEDHVEAPAWLDGVNKHNPQEIVAVANGLLHLPTKTLLPNSPAYFNLTSSEVAYDPQARAPMWLAHLDSAWPQDREVIETFQEYCGYALSTDTALQKILLVIGPPRSGKGVLARVMRELCGSTASPTLDGLTSNFGLQPLIGETLAIVPDARLSGRANVAALVERMLSISGEDALTIDRKYLPPWTGRLKVRFAIFTNELPRLVDASGALASRLIILTMKQSFLGREDSGLTQRLLSELPGILNWALEGYHRIRARGHLVQPASSREAMTSLEEIASPITAFVREKCVVVPSEQCTVDALYAAWSVWCGANGHLAGGKPNLGRLLSAAYPSIHVMQLRNPGGVGTSRTRVYGGIGLAP